jgi:hypothetical protein
MQPANPATGCEDCLPTHPSGARPNVRTTELREFFVRLDALMKKLDGHRPPAGGAGRSMQSPHEEGRAPRHTS